MWEMIDCECAGVGIISKSLVMSENDRKCYYTKFDSKMYKWEFDRKVVNDRKLEF